MRLCYYDPIAQNPKAPCPPELFNQLIAIPVRFAIFCGGLEKKVVDKVEGEGEGIIEVHRDLATDVQELFRFMLAERFPLSCVLPIAEFGWDDESSMSSNNTSGFNYRTIADTKRLSMHARGRAIDINPLFNPCIRGNVVQPRGARYDPSFGGTLTADSRVTQFLKARGWIWGGDWTCGRDGLPLKDYQHFEKPE